MRTVLFLITAAAITLTAGQAGAHEPTGFFRMPGGILRWLGYGYGHGYHARPCPPPRHAPWNHAGVQPWHAGHACQHCQGAKPSFWSRLQPAWFPDWAPKLEPRPVVAPPVEVYDEPVRPFGYAPRELAPQQSPIEE